MDRRVPELWAMITDMYLNSCSKSAVCHDRTCTKLQRDLVLVPDAAVPTNEHNWALYGKNKVLPSLF